ncbi:MAG: DUF1460 domain-containing protein [Bacteroidetes bacterium]|nr:DUF1460 domain-containing protein [Bacteroidota bacterium]
MKRGWIVALFAIIQLQMARPSVAQEADSGKVGAAVVNVDYSYAPVCPPSTDSSLKAIMQRLNASRVGTLPIGARIVAAGKELLGKPYLDKTLEVGEDMIVPVCNLEGFDCVTLFENAWAFGRLAKNGSSVRLGNLSAEIRTTRYRDGRENGFYSRLHYTTDYFYNNTQRGLLKEMTRTIGKKYAILETKPINFMTKHPNLYKQLKDDPAMVAKMDSIERMISARGGFYYIKKENVEKIESGIQDGDLIGITTSIPGIDISHTGIAVKGDDGRIHFMNASSVFHKVIISKEPLADYLANNSKQTGIIVYRPIEQP